MTNHSFTNKLRKSIDWGSDVIEWLFVWVPAIYGSLLLFNQIYVWMREDVWVPLHAKYLFVRPESEGRAPEVDPSDDVPRLTIRQERGATQKLFHRIIPVFNSEDSWFARPTSWFGLHRFVSTILEGKTMVRSFEAKRYSNECLRDSSNEVKDSNGFLRVFVSWWFKLVVFIKE